MTLAEPQVVVDTFDDPAERARSEAQFERFRRNSDWLQQHWSDLLPAARGRFVAVAGQQAFVADTSEEAWAKARAAHPDDDGAFSQYIPPHTGPRAYANRWRVVAGR